jgi:hypothetical protein
MASSSSHNNNGIPVATLLGWYKIRDTFFGRNKVSQNIRLALEMVGSCEHPDARWLTEACAGKDVLTMEDATQVFLAHTVDDDTRAMCYVSLGFPDLLRLELPWLSDSARSGFAFAQALFAEALLDHDDDDDDDETKAALMFVFSQQAAAQGERDGYYWLGWCYLVGNGCDEDLNLALKNFLLASILRHAVAMSAVGRFFDESDPERWHWWGMSAAHGDSWAFLSHFAKRVELFKSGSGSSAGVMFAIGRALQGHVNSRTIFNDDIKFDSRVGPAKQAIAFYEAQIKATKDAMRAWTLVGIHFNVVKDVRKLIAALIWDSREDALYDAFAEGVQDQEESSLKRARKY